MAKAQQPPSIDDLRAEVSAMLDRLDPAAPIAATVTFLVDPDQEAEFVRRAQALADATRLLPGDEVFVFHKREAISGPDPDPPEYVIYEDWDSVAHFRRQWDSPHLIKFQHGVGELLADPARSPPDLRFFHGTRDTGAPGGHAKAPVLATGQTKCWDWRGKEIDGEGSGQDGALRAGVPIPRPRFHDNHDGTVTDRLTGLIWLKDADRFGEVTWAEALQKANELAGGGVGLNDGSRERDWRLPNIVELRSLIDYSSRESILAHGHPFTDVQQAIYWTSSTLVSSPELAWMSTLAIGPSVFDLKVNTARMWPVRGGERGRLPRTGQTDCFDSRGNKIADPQGTGQDGELRKGVPSPEPRFHDNGDGTVTDRLTELVWLKVADPFGNLTWQEALDECNSLRDGQHDLSDGSEEGDWRLPNAREMESIVHYGVFAPSVPDLGQPFTDLRPTSYWTSTTVPSAPTQAMFVILGVGPTIFENKEVPLLAWPVRDRRRRR
jgi:quinol monooxygenase YgiN